MLTRVYDVRDLLTDGQGSDSDALCRLRYVIRDTIATESWKFKGGAVGSMFAWNGRLIVTQTWTNHVRIESLLAGMRRSGLGSTAATGPATSAQ